MPTSTFSIAAGADDARAYSNFPATYAAQVYSAHDTTGLAQGPQRGASGGTFYTDVGLLRFNTSALPDTAVITAATLKLYMLSFSNANSRNLVGEYYAWTGSASSDWTLTAPASPILSFSLSSLVASVTNDIALTDFSGISKTGNTSIRLHVSGGQPAGDNTCNYWTYESSNPEPQLAVTYTLGTDLVGMAGI